MFLHKTGIRKAWIGCLGLGEGRFTCTARRQTGTHNNIQLLATGSLKRSLWSLNHVQSASVCLKDVLKHCHWCGCWHHLVRVHRLTSRDQSRALLTGLQSWPILLLWGLTVSCESNAQSLISLERPPAHHILHGSGERKNFKSTHSSQRRTP